MGSFLHISDYFVLFLSGPAVRRKILRVLAFEFHATAWHLGKKNE